MSQIHNTELGEIDSEMLEHEMLVHNLKSTLTMIIYIHQNLENDALLGEIEENIDKG